MGPGQDWNTFSALDREQQPLSLTLSSWIRAIPKHRQSFLQGATEIGCISHLVLTRWHQSVSLGPTMGAPLIETVQQATDGSRCKTCVYKRSKNKWSSECRRELITFCSFRIGNMSEQLRLFLKDVPFFVLTHYGLVSTMQQEQQSVTPDLHLFSQVFS